MKKRFFSIILSITLVCSCLQVSVMAEEPESQPCEHLNQTEWNNVNENTGLPAVSGKYVLTADITLTGVWQINSGVDISICLNGHSITQTVPGQRVIYVKGGSLSVYDCAGTGRITGASSVSGAGAGVRVDGGGVFNLYGGSVTGNSGSGIGTGIYVTAAAFNMHGGCVSDNHNNGNDGGGIGMNGTAVINITGGEISGNTARNGGGIMVQSGNNKVLLKDTVITGNTATTNGGGVYAGGNTAKQISLSGDLQIIGNLKGGKENNLFIPNNATQDRSVRQEDLLGSARIGVTVNNDAYSTLVYEGATAATASCYIPDSSARAVEYSAGTLTLIIKPSQASAHTLTEGYTACGHGTTGWAAWYKSTSLPEESGCYYLAGDVELSAAWTVSEGTEITLCLNGHNITQIASGERVVYVKGGILNICDCASKTEDSVYTAGKITGASAVASAGAGVRVDGNGTFNLYDGIITENTCSTNGGGVYVTNASFNMYGGCISGNTAGGFGGGVYTDTGAEAGITGGRITGNSAVRGGGISVEKAGSVLLKDVEITGNTATGTDASNTNHRGGGGVFVNANLTVSISGTVRITDNSLGEKTSNLVVAYNRVVKEDSLDTASRIGIGAYPDGYTEVASVGSASTAACYTADDSEKIAQLDGKLMHVIDKPEGYHGTHSTDHGNHEVTAENWIPWGIQDKLPTASGSYYLTCTVNLTEAWTVENGQNIKLCLNGFDIIQKTPGERIAFITKGTVTFCDCSAAESDGTYTAGRLTGASYAGNGGAIYLGGAESRLNIHDVIITGNTAKNGGALRIDKDASVNLYSGEIKGNFAPDNGGAIHVLGTLNMTGGKIVSNGERNGSYTTAGGAIAVSGGGKADILGGEISGNTAKNGGGIVIQGENPAVILGDVLISGNSASGMGGGVCASYSNTDSSVKSLTLGGTVSITGNTANGKASNLFLGASQTFYTDSLSEGAEIGVRTNGAYPKTLISEGVSDGIKGYFTSDVNGRSLYTEDGALLLGISSNASHTPHAVDECGHDGAVWTEWAEDSSLPAASGHYYLISDVNLTGIWNAGDGKEITICLNGHSIKQTASGLRILRVGTSTVNICDCTAKEENGEYTSGKLIGSGDTVNDDAGAMMLTGAGKLRLYDGIITSTKATGNGAIVVQNSFSFEMHGGRIRGHAAGKNGGAIYVTGGGTFLMTGGVLNTNTAAENGGALYINNGSASLEGGYIRGNSAKSGGAAGVGSNGKLTLSGTEISNNTSSSNGGGIVLYNTEMTMTGGRIRGNRTEITRDGDIVTGARGMGGGIAVMSSKFVMTGGQISDNQAAGGAGIYAMHRDNNTINPTVELRGGTVSGNHGMLDGSGIRVEGVSESDPAGLVLDGVEIKENSPFETTGENGKISYAAAAGGLAAKNCRVTITGSTRIVRNRASNAAAAYFNGSEVSMDDGLISTNTGTGNGAGIYAANSKISVKGGFIRFNEADGNGGGFFLSGAELTVDGGEIQGNSGGMGGGIYSYGSRLTVNGGKIYNNKAYKVGGGGIYSTVNEKTGAASAVGITGGEISGNSSKSDGAGVRIDSGEFTMSGGLITGNKAVSASAGGLRLVGIRDAEITGGEISKNTANNAAGIYVKDSTLSVTGGLITRNVAEGSGAGMLASGSEIKLDGGRIVNNYAKGDGGGIYVSGGTLDMSDGTVTENRADKVCAGVLVSNKARFNLSGGEISKNVAKASSGGVMVQNGSRMKMTAGAILDNVTVNYGGGIYINKDSSLDLSGGTVRGNAARKSGGGIYVGKDGSMNMSGGTVNANDATVSGGGLDVCGDTNISGGTIRENTSKKEGAGAYVSDAALTMTGGSFDGNKTEYNGGGLCVRGEKGLLVLRDGEVINNECAESGGGILVQGGGKLMMYGGKVNGNLAPNGGGGIRLHLCAAEIYGGEINDNVSYGAGAGIYTNLSLVIKDAEVCNNRIENKADIKTRSSAAIRTYNESVLEMENVKVAGNMCDGRAGAVEIAYNVKADIRNCVFENNSSTERGGAFSIYREGVANLTDCTVTGNSAGGNGGAFSLDPYGTVNLTNCDVSGNRAGTAGVCYVGTKGRAVFEGCELKDNTADVSFSAIYANGDVVLTDTVITGNTDKGGSAAVYLDNDGTDNESYLPGVYEIKGNTVIAGNNGGDLVLAGNAFINIHGDGLGDSARIMVRLSDDDLLRWIIGPYDYEKTGDAYLLTRGEASLDAAFLGGAEGGNEADASEAPGSDTSDMEASEDGSDPGPGLIIGLSSVIAAALGVLAAVLLKKSRKKH